MKASLRFDAHNSPYTDLGSSPPITAPCLPSSTPFHVVISQPVHFPKFAMHPTNSCVRTKWGVKAIWGENQPDFIVPSGRSVVPSIQALHSSLRHSPKPWVLLDSALRAHHVGHRVPL